jgi:hypothetical protein
MRWMIVIAIALAACDRKPAGKMAATSGKSAAMDKPAAMGSAMGTTMHDAAAAQPSP